jgi:hypothetical protein
LAPALRTLDAAALPPNEASIQATLKVVSVPGGRHQAELTVLLQRGYPGVAAQCVVTSPTQRRAWESTTTDVLQDKADSASRDGANCLHELLALLQEQVDAADAEDAEEEAAAAHAPQPLPTTVTLLRLDHMRDRARYGRTLADWAAELGLEGRLVFNEALIIVLVHGIDGAIREFLLRARTRPVDVDSKGRPCKEHMLRVERSIQRPPSGDPLFGGRFAQVHVSSLQLLRDMLASAGVADWLDEYLPS